MLNIQPATYIFFGLLMSLLSFVPSIIRKNALMTGEWLKISLPLFGDVKLGTPFIFDIGVFFTVIGVTLMFFFSLIRNK